MMDLELPLPYTFFAIVMFFFGLQGTKGLRTVNDMDSFGHMLASYDVAVSSV